VIIRFDSNCSKSMATGGGGSGGGGEPAARSLQLDTSGIIAPLRREEILSSWERGEFVLLAGLKNAGTKRTNDSYVLVC